MDGIDHPLSARAEFDLEDATVSFVQSRLQVDPATVGVRKTFTNDVTQHAFVNQQIVGHPAAYELGYVLTNPPSLERCPRRQRRRKHRIQQGQQGRLVRLFVCQTQ